MTADRRACAACASVLSMGLLAALPLAAEQLTLEQYNGLKRGMSESEVFYRVGEPDRVTVDGVDIDYGYGYYGHRRELHYIPDEREHDPHLSIVHVRSGKVASLERIKLLTRAPIVPAPSRDAVVDRDHGIRAGRAERTLNAAERYSAVRARLKAENAGRSGSDPGRPLYRSQGSDGVRYYGDRPSSPNRVD